MEILILLNQLKNIAAFNGTVHRNFSVQNFTLDLFRLPIERYTVCPGRSDPPEKISNIFASENEV